MKGLKASSLYIWLSLYMVGALALHGLLSNQLLILTDSTFTKCASLKHYLTYSTIWSISFFLLFLLKQKKIQQIFSLFHISVQRLNYQLCDCCQNWFNWWASLQSFLISQETFASWSGFWIVTRSASTQRRWIEVACKPNTLK